MLDEQYLSTVDFVVLEGVQIRQKTLPFALLNDEGRKKTN